MRELQTCDFCGADPVGVYEPLPAGLAADQPRVALCGDCRDTLRRVLAPLDADAASDNVAADHATDAESSTAERETASAPADSTDDADTTGAEGAGGGEATAERPPGYGEVLRLVRNREESLSRADLEAIASSAYDMSASEVQRAVDAAVENGDLREADGAVRPT